MRITIIKKIYLILFAIVLCCLATTIVFVVSANSLKEKTEIFISVNTMSYSEDELPEGVVGKTYPIFDCQAVDENGEAVINIDILVYNPEGDFVPITCNRFETKTKGKYTIVYNATKDTAESTVELWVNVISENEYKIPYYEFNSEIVDFANTGTQIALPNGNYGGGNGKVDVRAEIIYDGLYDCPHTEIENYGLYDFFKPVVEGTYTLKYTLTDILNEKITAEKSIIVEDSEKPIIREPSLALSGIVGKEMCFEHTEGVVYAEGKKVYVPVKTFVNDCEITTNMTYTPDSAGVYIVKYEATNTLIGGATSSLIYEVSVTDTVANKQAGLPFINNYLYLDGLDGKWRELPDNTPSEEGIEYDVYLLKANGTKQSVNAQFGTAIPTKYAGLSFGVDTKTSSFDSISIRFTDSNNGEKVVTIALKKNDKKVDVYVNGHYKITLSKSLVYPSTNEDSSFSFSIDSVTGILKEVSTSVEICKLTSYDNGTKFDGFESGLFYLNISADNVNDDFALKLYELCSQHINGATSDRGKPFLLTPSNFTQFFSTEYNKQFTVPAFSAFDLFDTNVNVNVKIIAPNNGLVYDGTISSEGYTFVPTQYGNYNLIYEVSDSVGNVREVKCVITVIDREAPTITQTSIPSNVKVGDTLELSAVNASDNSNKSVITWIYVTYDNYQRITIIDGRYKFEKAGTYLIKYGAEDQDGNFTVLTYTVICE